MNLKLRSIEDAEEARSILPWLERGVRESSLAYREEAVPEGTGEDLLRRCLGRPETLLVVAESESEVVALAATAPFEDPLTGESSPLLVALYVDPSLRHRGVARALVRELQRLLASRGFSGLAARAAHNDDAIISMGERWGLVRTWEMMSTE